MNRKQEHLAVQNIRLRREILRERQSHIEWMRSDLKNQDYSQWVKTTNAAIKRINTKIRESA